MLSSPQSLKKVLKASGAENEEVVNQAFSYIEGTIEGIIDEYGDDAIEQLKGWLEDDFVEVFGEYLEEEMEMDEDEVESIDLRAIGDAIAELF